VSPPFRPLTPEEDEALVAQINAAKPDFVWVGLGAPQQDLVGRFAPIAAECGRSVGRRRRLRLPRRNETTRPRWMQRTGTEWFFRLAMEPRRLARRYTVVNARFLQLVIQDALRRRFHEG